MRCAVQLHLHHVSNVTDVLVLQSQVKTRFMLSVFVVAAFCTVCFLARGIINFIWVEAIEPMLACTKAQFEIYFYLCIEVMPSLAVLFVMRAMPQRERQQSSAAGFAKFGSHLDEVDGTASRASDDRASQLSARLLEHARDGSSDEEDGYLAAQ